MSAYEKWFDASLREDPYEDPEEYRLELCAFADLLLGRLRELQRTGEGRPAGLALTLENASAAPGEDGAPARRTANGKDLRAAWLHLLERAQRSGPELAGYHRVCALLGLAPLCRIALLLTLYGYLDRKYEKLFTLLNDDQSMPFPSLGTALAAAEEMGMEPQEGELAEFYGFSGAARLLFLPPEQRAGLSMPLRAHPTVVQAALCGEFETARELRGFCSVWRCDSPLEEAVYGEGLIGRLAALARGMDAEGEFVSARAVLLLGEDGSGRGFLARHAAKRLGINLVEVDMRRFPSCAGERLEELLTALAREFSLRPGMLFLRGCAINPESTGPLPELLEGIAGFCPLFWLSAEPQEAARLREARIPMLELEVPAPGFADTAALFRHYAAYLPVAPGVDFEELASRYRMTPGAILGTLETARMRAYADGSAEITAGQLAASLRTQRIGALEGLGGIVSAGYGWEDLVVPPATRRIMRLAVDHLKYRRIVGEEWGLDRKNAYGRGICVLFYGAPGTGKTMAAHVLANAAGMDLFKVDASRLTSKYIGETSKNMAQVFDHVKGGNVILFFDEADAIFGRRSDVKDSNDRYANSDTAFLLQKIEEYDGMTILSTNLLSNIDDAFRRRVTYAVNFQPPNQELRERLWRSLTAPELPHEELDYAFLSRFELTGSGIKSILLSAAYMAAGEGAALSMAHLARALTYYMAKSGKNLSMRELFPYGEADGQ